MHLFSNSLLKKRNKLAATTLLMIISLIFVVIIFSVKYQKDMTAPFGKKGVLDLRNWVFEEDGVVDIEGEWEIYGQKLLTPQDFLETRALEPDFFYTRSEMVNAYQQKENYFTGDSNFFTCRLDIKLKNGVAETLSLKFPRNFGTINKIWVNDELVFTEERPGESKVAEIGPGRILDLDRLQLNQSHLQIIMQNRNNKSSQKVFKDAILLGRKDLIYKQRERGLVFDTILIISLLLAGLYYLAIFLFRYQDSSLLYFSLFCFVINLRVIGTGEAFLLDYFNLTNPLIQKILLLSYYLAVPLFCSFVANVYPQEFSKKIVVGSQISGIAFFMFILIIPSGVMLAFVYKIIILFLGLYSLHSITIAFIKNREDSLLFFIGFVSLFIVIVNDILYSCGLINTAYYLRPGLLIFLFIQSFILFGRLTRDYTQTKSMVQNLQTREDIFDKTEKFKGQFLVNASQKIKLPLNNMISALQSTIVNSEISLHQETRKKLVSINKMGNGLNYIFDSIITYIKIKQGDMGTNQENLELYQMIDYIIEIFKPVLANKDIHFENHIQPQKFIVIVDRNHFIQIFYHLLDHLSTTIKAGKVVFKARMQNDNLELCLEAKGTNLFLKHRNWTEFKFKEKFIYNHSELKEDIILRLIKLQGGSLEIKKLPNKLLVISIILPGLEYNGSYHLEAVSREASVVSNTNEPQREVEIQRGKTILLVSDKSHKNNPLREILQEENYDIKVISDKKRVVETINNKFSLVILNLLAFDQSAIQLCRKIREQFKLLELPILIMVTRTTPENLMEGFELGINDLIKEPFEVNELKARVRTLITLNEKVEESIAREQDFLRAQIKPHFLYNTLDTIAYLAKRNPKEAEDLILGLANYLRYSFDFENLKLSVPIKRELELVNFYLTIQQKRFGERIKVIYNIEEGLSFELPPLILQPIVENAIKHGILKKKQGGTVQISIQSTGEFIEIKITDDGVGMSKEEVANILHQGENHKEDKKNKRRKVGLDNINRRLRELYNQKLTLKSKEGVGTTVEFKITERG